MKIIEKGIMPDGTCIQIEDWSKDYSFYSFSDTLGCYPKSKETHDGLYAPKRGKTNRFSFRFKNAEEAKGAYDDLLKGVKVLSDFKCYLDGKSEYRDCI